MLFFACWDHPQLLEWRYRRSPEEKEIFAIRAKCGRVFGANATFQWTAAVKALSVIFLRLAARPRPDANGVLLAGAAGSLAASLDDALYKQPAWICELLGTDAQGNACAKRIFHRLNSGRKRPGPVSIALSVFFLQDLKLEIFLEQERLSAAAELEAMAETIVRQAVTARVTDGDGSATVKAAGRCTKAVGLGKDRLRVKILSADQKSLSFRQEWLPLVNQVAQETHECLRGMTFDGEVSRWWLTVSGRLYLLANLALLKVGKKVKRIFILRGGDPTLEFNTLAAAYLNKLAGVETRVVREERYRRVFPLAADMISVHDSDFAAVHNVVAAEGVSTIIQSQAGVAELSALYEEIFSNTSVASTVTKIAASYRHAAALRSTVDSEYRRLHLLAKRKNILDLLMA